ncbi:MAG TPA: hypothetical protein VF085_09895 [Solirubrobacterales bacterium]
MLIHDRFVFLHVPKTGGRFVRQALAQELPDCREVDEHKFRHKGWSKIPSEATGKPVLTFIRNPWDWYVSWYTYIDELLSDSKQRDALEQIRSRNILFRRLFPAGSDSDDKAAGNGFAATIRRACSGVLKPEDRAKLAPSMWGFDSVEMLLAGYDFYSAAVMSTFGAGLNSDLLTVGRYESLVEDLELFIEREAGVKLTIAAKSRIRAMAPVGASRRGPYRDYYDNELRETVSSSCRELIERFDYSSQVLEADAQKS